MLQGSSLVFGGGGGGGGAPAWSTLVDANVAGLPGGALVEYDTFSVDDTTYRVTTEGGLVTVNRTVGGITFSSGGTGVATITCLLVDLLGRAIDQNDIFVVQSQVAWNPDGSGNLYSTMRQRDDAMAQRMKAGLGMGLVRGLGGIFTNARYYNTFNGGIGQVSSRSWIIPDPGASEVDMVAAGMFNYAVGSGISHGKAGVDFFAPAEIAGPFDTKAALSSQNLSTTFGNPLPVDCVGFHVWCTGATTATLKKLRIQHMRVEL